jgi:hypothetical protein
MRCIGRLGTCSKRLKDVGIPHHPRGTDNISTQDLGRMKSDRDARGVVTSYIGALDSRDYDAAKDLLADGIRIRGPAGESFRTPNEFIGMLRSYNGKYDVKRVFSDGEDVCLIYDLVTPAGTALMCSWYQVREGEIASIQSIFDPRSFGPPPAKTSA